MDLVQVHLKKDVERPPALGVVDLTSVREGEIDHLTHTKIISLPLLARTLIAMNQNGMKKVLIQFRSDQRSALSALEKHPLLAHFSTWLEVEPKTASVVHPEVVERLQEAGGYWVAPNFLMNGIFLDVFETGFDRLAEEATEVISARESSDHVLWIPKSVAQKLPKSNGSGLAVVLKSAARRDVAWTDPQAYGQLIAQKQDIRRAEKLLCVDITRKKGGVLAKLLNEPISLWIAKHCAKVPAISPNFITLLNTLLGVTSAWLVYFGAHTGQYWPIAAGAILFYAVDIFDGIDGELARFTFRYSKNGALYDTISDNITLMSFIAASYYAAFMHVKKTWVVVSGVYTVAASVGAVFYLLWFTTRHFGNASLRLYEARFLPMVPKSDPVVRFIEFMKHFYTKDVLCAMLALPLILNLPILISLGAPLVISLMFVGFIYLGLRYGHLLNALLR